MPEESKLIAENGTAITESSPNTDQPLTNPTMEGQPVSLKKMDGVIANICLLVWALLLAVIGMQAVSGKASTVILDIAGKIANTTQQDPPKQSPAQGVGADVLSQYTATKYPGLDETAIPPIAIVLDQFQDSNFDWRLAQKSDPKNPGKKVPLWASDYNNLFDIVGKRLEAIADFSPEVSVGSTLSIHSKIIPPKYRPNNFVLQEVDIPLEAVLWVKARQTILATRKTQISFLDLFILLIILGGFGSWIYLVRRHVDPKTQTSLYEYFYRPPLGMALAIAVFIVNITLHSFVSTSDIKDVRRETLILLAFTAGLLSDKTYDFIEKVTGDKLAGNPGNNKNPSEASGGQPS